MSRIAAGYLQEIREHATKLVGDGLSSQEVARVQRMLIEDCRKLAELNGLDAQSLYWAAIHYADNDKSIRR